MSSGIALATLTYLEFHLLFVLPPIAALLVLADPAERPYAGPLGVALLAVVAVLYTTPWDNHLIATGVWTYGEGTVRFRIWNAPIGEYLFFLLQPVLTSLWLVRLPTRSDYEPGIPLSDRALGLLGGGLVAALGFALLSKSTYYLGTLLLWASPVLAIQWAFGWPVLWERRRTLALGVGVPTTYLAVIDRVAIALGVWTFDETYLTGIEILGLPVEELLFFGLTNLFLVQGLLLLWWVTDHWAQVRTAWNRGLPIGS
ncbi:MAG: lycopene cyclase domain-containing protein [Halorientalis sp.]